MAFTPAIPLQPITHTKMQFDGTYAQAQELVAAINSALTDELLSYGYPQGYQEGDGIPKWKVILKRPDQPFELVATEGMWIVVSNLGKIRVLTDAEYGAEFQRD